MFGYESISLKRSHKEIHIYVAMFYRMSSQRPLGSSPRMERPLALGGLSGVASSLLVSLLHSFAAETRDRGLGHLPIPTCLDPPALQLEDIPWLWFAAGVAVGFLLVGPLIDLLWLLKQRWRRYILELASPVPSTRALHKVLG